MSNISKKSWIYTIGISLLPVIMMYKVPVVNLGFSTFIIALLMIPAGIVIILNAKKSIKLNQLTPFYIYLLYACTKSSMQMVILLFSVFVHLFAISYGIMDVNLLKRIVKKVAVIAALAVMLQTISHILFNYHIQMININWCLDSMERYRSIITTGVGKSETLYRPSAFFLEPSHLAEYCIIALVVCLFNEKPDKKSALVISLGIVLSTSGIGIISVFGIWIYWFVKKSQRRIIDDLPKIISGIFAVLIVFLVLNQFEAFRVVISRFTGQSKTGYNAIHGRFFWWDTYFKNYSFKDLLWGFGYSSLPDVYFTGMMTQLYAFGIIGFSIFIIALIVLFIKSKYSNRVLILIYFALLFGTNLTGFIYLIFYIGTICALQEDISDIESSMHEIV